MIRNSFQIRFFLSLFFFFLIFKQTLVKLIENRDREIADLKSYIDGLLLRVINSCPTLLQTSVNRDTVASPHAQFKKISK